MKKNILTIGLFVFLIQNSNAYNGSSDSDHSCYSYAAKIYSETRVHDKVIGTASMSALGAGVVYFATMPTTISAGAATLLVAGSYTSEISTDLYKNREADRFLKLLEEAEMGDGALLRQLKSDIEKRFNAVLDPNTISERVMKLDTFNIGCTENKLVDFDKIPEIIYLM